MWTDLIAAIALVLIIEGILPFLNPQAFRKTITMVAQFDDRSLRLTGLITMGAGVLLLYVVR